MSDNKERRREEAFVLNPVFGIAMLSTCLVCGFGWIAYAIGSIIASNAVGYYVEAKINQLDTVTRLKAKEATGEDQPGDARELGELVRRTNQTLGVFCPAIPLVSLMFGWYMSYKAHRLAKVGCGETRQAKQIALVPGFAAEGRCVF